MNNTDDEEGPCVREGISLRSDGYRYYSAVYAAVNLLLVIVSVFLWLRWRNRSSYLLNRNFSSIWILAVGFLCQLATGSFTRTSGDENSIQSSCFLSTFPYFMVLPCLLLAGTLRIMLFFNRYKYNKKLSDSFELSNFCRSANSSVGATVSSTESSKELEKLRKRALEAYANKRGIFVLIIISVFSMMYSAESCPEIGNSNDCSVATASESSPYNLITVGFMLVLIGFTYYVHRKTRQYPDPFGILTEVRTALILTISIGIPCALLFSYDVGDFFDKDPHRFGFELGVDFGIAILFYHTVPYQIYRGMKILHNRAILMDVTLAKILENEIGKALFRQHLVNEFSVENLNFIEAVEAYKSMFRGVTDSRSIQKSASKIHGLFIAPSAPNLLNVSALSTSTVREAYANDQFTENLFEPVYIAVYNLVASDSFLRFRKSREFNDYFGTTQAFSV